MLAAEIAATPTSLEQPDGRRLPASQPAATTQKTTLSRSKDVDSASTLYDTLPYSAQEIPLTYHHLTFDTQLPSPGRTRPSVDDTLAWNPPPPCPNLRDFDNPFEWSRSRKAFITCLSCAVTITCAYSAGSYDSAADQLTAKWGISDVAFNVGITIFTVGFGVAPMALAPLSEEYGRRPVFLLSGILYVGKHLVQIANID